jgi:hypothetical protein
MSKLTNRKGPPTLRVLALAFACGLVSTAAAQTEPLTPRVIAAQIAPTVVSIAAYDQWGETIGTGTGFFVDDQGTFVTNWHVLEGAMRLRVELSTGERFDNVYLVTDDQQRDVALLRIPAERTPAATLGVDQDLEVGDPVYVMGNPLGLDRTFSNGMVSARRMIEGSESIQITAPISPGSSGGPVMDERGRVVGIATWYYESGQNLNMAVPIRYVRPLLAMPHVPTLFTGTSSTVTTLAATPLERSSRQREARIQTRADDLWAQQVLEQLVEVESVALSQKLIRSHDPVIGQLRNTQNGIVTIRVESGIGYLIVGACDEDCDDLDFFLYDAANNLLAKDDEYGDIPLVTYDGGPANEVSLRVRMYSCQLEPCAFGVAVFREP